MCDTLQRPGNGTVSFLRKGVTQFSVQLGHLFMRPAPRPTQLAGVIVPTQLADPRVNTQARRVARVLGDQETAARRQWRVDLS